MQKKDKKVPLAPTVWRTVRAVMNPVRLNLLRTVLFSSGRDFTVSDLARMFNIDQPVATIYLRQLNSRGLLGVTRGRIKVFYNSSQDRSLPDSIELQNVLRTCMSEPPRTGWEEELLTILKGFSHFNRLAIIVRLAEGPATIDQLAAAVGGCVKSMYHHLRILYSAGLIDGEGANNKATVFRLVANPHPLARTLLKITLRNQERFARYWNPPSSVDAATRAVLRRIEAHEGYAPWRQKKVQSVRAGSFRKGTRHALSEVETG